jgi:anaerobic magnesium-protoporphyrin IX monomethyl ester cyclase
MGCLKAFLKSGFERTFYDLGRVGYWGPQSKKKVDFAFDASAPTSGPTAERWPSRCRLGDDARPEDRAQAPPG